MTAKRFRLGYVCGDFGLIDNAQSEGNQWTDLHSMSEHSEKNVQICINKMNELAEENEQLRKENEKLEALWEDKCIKEYMKIVGENALQEMHNEKYGDK